MQGLESEVLNERQKQVCELPPHTRVEALRQVETLLGFTESQRDCIRFWFQFWTHESYGDLLNNQELAADPVAMTRVQSFRLGMERMASELSNPDEIKETAEWLSLLQQHEKESTPENAG